MVRYTLRKPERLSRRSEIRQLFADGDSLFEFPVKLIFLFRDPNEQPTSRVIVSAARRRLKRAVHRNRMKRLMRESFRHLKPGLNQKLEEQNMAVDLGIVYVDGKLCDYKELNNKIADLFQRFYEAHEL